jgi:hypothetical protein
MHLRPSVRALLILAMALYGADAGAWWTFGAKKGASKTPQTIGRTVIPLTDASIRAQFPNKPLAAVERILDNSDWAPSKKWLDTVGKRYGRLLIVSDLHAAGGQNPVTHKIHPTEDFKPNEHEVDFRRMLETQWTSAAREQEKTGRRKVCTLVLNGDTLEILQTMRPALGTELKGVPDRYGPPDTPENAVAKLRAIQDGHPMFFATLAEHMYRDNRVVLIPGNHDRQLLHPTVRKVFTRHLVHTMVEVMLQDGRFQKDHAGQGKHKQKRLARLEAKGIVAQHLEFHPWRAVIGDVLIAHGNDSDKYNSLSHPFAEYYHPTAKDGAMKAAMGDYIVKGIFNQVEIHTPWTDNTARRWPTIKAGLLAARLNPLSILRLASYLLTREGGPSDKREAAKAETRLAKDVRKYTREFGLLERFNAVRPEGQTLTEDQLVQTLLKPELLPARPVLDAYNRKYGLLRRSLTWLARLTPYGRTESPSDHESKMLETLIRDLHLKTVVVGHDHTFRVESRLVVDQTQGKAIKASLIDSATWNNQLPEIRRDWNFAPEKRRGVVVVDFDEKGSHARLTNYARGIGLTDVPVLENVDEAGTPTLLQLPKCQLQKSQRWCMDRLSRIFSSIFHRGAPRP